MSTHLAEEGIQESLVTEWGCLWLFEFRVCLSRASVKSTLFFQRIGQPDGFLVLLLMVESV